MGKGNNTTYCLQYVLDRILRELPWSGLSKSKEDMKTDICFLVQIGTL